VCLAGCNRGSQDKEAVRQGILEHLKAGSMNLSSMTMDLTSVKFNGNHADATASFYPKGQSAAQGMAFEYQLERQNGKWAVVGRAAVGAPHGSATAAPGGAMPGAESPHGGAKMPSPEDLPPAGKKP
jgi:hypothetical protein